jgi:hypothetical protein
VLKDHYVHDQNQLKNEAKLAPVEEGDYSQNDCSGHARAAVLAASHQLNLIQ